MLEARRIAATWKSGRLEWEDGDGIEDGEDEDGIEYELLYRMTLIMADLSGIQG